jgi:hypothetical protein
MKLNRLLHIIIFSVATLFFICQSVIADPPEKPDNPGIPGLLAEISELQEIISQQSVLIEELENLLEQLQCSAPVQQTGATQSLAPGDDGDIKAGVQWPTPRFTDNDDGTVTDNLTGLIWLKNANCFGQRFWTDALNDSNTLFDGNCGLTDYSVAGDWRLANVNELLSLIDYSQNAPALPIDHPFNGVQASHYWSSTPSAGGSPWWVYFGGGVGTAVASNSYYVWPVRGGN